MSRKQAKLDRRCRICQALIREHAPSRCLDVEVARLVGWTQLEEMSGHPVPVPPSYHDWFGRPPEGWTPPFEPRLPRSMLWTMDGRALVPEYSTDLLASFPVAQQFRLMLIPVEVYASEEDWDLAETPDPCAVWWAAIPSMSNPSVYLPLEDYCKEWQGWVTNIADNIYLVSVAETLPLAICRAALLGLAVHDYRG